MMVLNMKEHGVARLLDLVQLSGALDQVTLDDAASDTAAGNPVPHAVGLVGDKKDVEWREDQSPGSHDDVGDAKDSNL